jgi:hypothetical protein
MNAAWFEELADELRARQVKIESRFAFEAPAPEVRPRGRHRAARSRWSSFWAEVFAPLAAAC